VRAKPAFDGGQVFVIIGGHEVHAYPDAVTAIATRVVGTKPHDEVSKARDLA
jgi:hypothetical protein